MAIVGVTSLVKSMAGPFSLEIIGEIRDMGTAKFRVFFSS